MTVFGIADYLSMYGSKKMLNKLIYIILVFLLTSCVLVDERCDYPSHILINVVTHMPEEDIAGVREDIKNNLLYSWDGEIIEGYVDSAVCHVLTIDNAPVREFKFKRGEKTDIGITDIGQYNILVYNKTDSVNYSQGTERFYTVAPYGNEKYDFEFVNKYQVIHNAEEQYSLYERDLISNFDFNDKSKYPIITLDSLKAYYCEVNRELSIVSYVYIIQVLIYDDNPDVPMNIKHCDFMALNGLAIKKDLYSLSNNNEIGTLIINDIKPIQNMGDYIIFASKVVTYGFPKIKQSSWGEDKKCELGIELVLKNGRKRKGVIDIGKKLAYRPNGGVITIALKNSDINKDTEENFDINVKNWSEYVFDIVF